MKGDQALTEQLMDLREVKATIRERLQSTEAALINARQRAVALESREKLHIQKIAALEVEASKNHIDASDSLQAESQIRELKSRNDTLQMQFAEFRRENLDTSEQLQQKLAEISELHLSETDLQSNLDEARKEAIILADERTIYESQAVAQAEQMRKDLSQAASSEQALLESRYMNQLQQLRQEKTVIEDRAEQRQRQLDRLQCEKDMADHLAEQRLQQLNDTEAERNQEVHSVDDRIRTCIVADDL